MVMVTHNGLHLWTSNIIIKKHKIQNKTWYLHMLPNWKKMSEMWGKKAAALLTEKQHEEEKKK